MAYPSAGRDREDVLTSLQAAVAEVVAGRDLSAPAMEEAMEAVLSGDAPEALIAALAVGLRMKGETTGEIAAAARAMRSKATPVVVPGSGPLLDTCGTGGDGAQSFNVSTVSAFVVAACGVRVAKHGNRAVSSRAGSADVLEELGLELSRTPDEVATQIAEVGIGFLFAPLHHQALRYAAPVRRTLGLRTFFNLLGPLSNPAGATHQLVGVYDPARLGQMAAVLGELGLERVWVVHGEGGLDEISPLGKTQVASYEEGKVRRFEVSPGDFGCTVRGEAALAGGDAEENARIARAILGGADDPRRDVVVMNAAAALVIAGVESGLAAAASRARAALDDGRAQAVLDRLLAWPKPVS